MNNTYKFAVNGQTGKVVGEYPIDNRKNVDTLRKLPALLI